MGSKIVGLGMCAPQKLLTNADLEKMVDTSDSWIMERTGIKERRVVPEEYGGDAPFVPVRKRA